MKQSEMQGFVDKLAQERKRHIEMIENTTIKDLREMVSKSGFIIIIEKEKLRAPSANKGGASIGS